MHNLDRISSLDDASLVLFPSLTQLLRLDCMLSLNYYEFDKVLDARTKSFGLDYTPNPNTCGLEKNARLMSPRLGYMLSPNKYRSSKM